jgi:hypothetical protein
MRRDRRSAEAGTLHNAVRTLRNAWKRARPTRQPRDNHARDWHLVAVRHLQCAKAMRFVPISEVITAAVGFLGITCTLNDGSLSERSVLRWMLSFAAITVTCLLGEAITAQRLLGAG